MDCEVLLQKKEQLEEELRELEKLKHLSSEQEYRVKYIKKLKLSIKEKLYRG